jgi:putative copper export protein
LGSLALAMLLLPDLLSAKATARGPLLGTVVPRLSTLVTGAVALLLATGVFGALIQVGSLQAFGTIYGGALLVKTVILAPMLALGAVNKFFFTPRFAASARRARGSLEGLAKLGKRFPVRDGG